MRRFQVFPASLRICLNARGWSFFLTSDMELMGLKLRAPDRLLVDPSANVTGITLVAPGIPARRHPVV